MGGHSSGPSSYEIQKHREMAEAEERRRIAKERANADDEASKGEMKGGEGSGDYYGALSKVKKKGSTLAGEGAQTFGANGNLGG